MPSENNEMFGGKDKHVLFHTIMLFGTNIYFVHTLKNRFLISVLSYVPLPSYYICFD